MARCIRPGNAIIYLFITGFSLFCFLPMLLVLMVSLTSEDSIVKNGYSFFPEVFSLDAYRMVFASGSIVLKGYGVSTIVTAVGTVTAVFITSMAAYTVANKNVFYRKRLSLFFYVSTLFSSGIVPWYLICLKLGLRNNLLALIVPSLLFNPFNMFLMAKFMDGIPDSLRESAVIDGANDIIIAVKVYLPLCLPIVATVSLFYGLAYWNDWWNAIMLVDKKEYFPLQHILIQLKSRAEMMYRLQTNIIMAGGITLPAESLKMATTIVTIGPIVLFYPYLQRYFIRGLTLGAVKD